MNDHALATLVSQLPADEPPLQLSPSRLLADGRRRRRTRSATITGATALGVAVVLGAAVALAPLDAAGDRAGTAGPSVSAPYGSKTDEQIRIEGEAIRAHLVAVLPTLLPDATGIEVGPVSSVTHQLMRGNYALTEVTFSDAAGPGRIFIQVSGPGTGRQWTKEDLCPSDKPVTDRTCTIVADGPDGFTLQSLIDQGKQGGRMLGIIQVRSGEVTVSATTFTYDPDDPDPAFVQTRADFPITPAELLQLVADPKLTLS